MLHTIATDGAIKGITIEEGSIGTMLIPILAFLFPAGASFFLFAEKTALLSRAYTTSQHPNR